MRILMKQVTSVSIIHSAGHTISNHPVRVCELTTRNSASWAFMTSRAASWFTYSRILFGTLPSLPAEWVMHKHWVTCIRGTHQSICIQQKDGSLICQVDQHNHHWPYVISEKTDAGLERSTCKTLCWAETHGSSQTLVVCHNVWDGWHFMQPVGMQYRRASLMRQSFKIVKWVKTAKSSRLSGCSWLWWTYH